MNDLINEINTVLPKDESLILESIKIRYLQGYYIYLQGDKNQENTMMKEAIDMMNHYNCSNFIKSYETHYKVNTT
ncbi:hypothetical protein [Nosocomiicoccus ampullae]|uniref:Rgg family transcriptional regulator n=1 Tax=Nosocomiicoccus ampullae TaxID=489910 RepID=UPI003C6DF999